MPLDHHFFLLETFVARNEWRTYVGTPAPLNLHDDVVGYLLDQLRWIPSWNPSKQVPSSGLNLYGPTVIDVEGAAIAERVFRGWANLLVIGPPVLDLQGYWSFFGDDPKLGAYERLRIDRTPVVETLIQLADYSACATNGTHALLHLGI